MKAQKAFGIAGALVLLAASTYGQYTPYFSVVNGGPQGLPGDNIWTPGPTPPNLFLTGTGAFEVDAISGNTHGIPEEWVFSVDINTFGIGGTAVNQEATLAAPLDHPADIYRSFGLGNNTLDWDGDGLANPLTGSMGFLGLAEQPALADDVDGLEVHGFPGNGAIPQPPGAIYYSLSQASASGIGFDGATLFMDPAVPLYDSPAPFAFAAQLGLIGGGLDDLDAAVVYDVDGFFDPSDQIFFSLTAGSQTLLNNGWSAADILVSQGGVVNLAVTANQLGLNGLTDNLDALDVIPEPSVIALFGLMGAGMLFIRRVFLI